MNIYLDKVSIEKKKILYKLLQYSLFEESLYDGNEMNNNGEFNYKDFDNYFLEDSKYVFFIKEQVTNKLLGFVMFSKYFNEHIIEEIMVIPKYRKRNIGKQTAFKCFDMFKGIWKVSPSLGSKLAYKFWEKVIDEYTNNKNEYINGTFIFNNK